MTLPKDPEKRALYLQQMSERQKARMADPEKKKLMDDKRREALKSPETRAKMSASAAKRAAQPEYQELIDKRNAVLRTPEYRARRSQMAKEHFTNPESRKKTSETTKAAMARPEVRERTSQAQRKRHANDPEFSARHSEFMKRLYEDPNMREIVSTKTKAAMQREDIKERYLQGMESSKELRQQVYSSPEYRAKLSETRKKMWQDPVYREKTLAEIATRKTQGTKIEVIIEDLLKSLLVEYESQKVIDYFIVDFYIPEKNLVIECDGDYWHNKPGAKAKDRKKDGYLKMKGYSILRLPEHRILANDLADFYGAVS